jgi:hypothetical protein
VVLAGKCADGLSAKCYADGVLVCWLGAQMGPGSTPQPLWRALLRSVCRRLHPPLNSQRSRYHGLGRRTRGATSQECTMRRCDAGPWLWGGACHSCLPVPLTVFSDHVRCLPWLGGVSMADSRAGVAGAGGRCACSHSCTAGAGHGEQGGALQKVGTGMDEEAGGVRHASLILTSLHGVLRSSMCAANGMALLGSKKGDSMQVWVQGSSAMARRLRC